MENQFYHIRLAPLSVTFLLRTCVYCVMGATPMYNTRGQTADKLHLQAASNANFLNLNLCVNNIKDYILIYLGA